MLDLITIGDAVVDTHVQIDNASVECNLDGHSCKLCLDYATKIPITDSFQAVGGDGANVAVGATKLGLNTAIITTLGKDSNGRLVEQDMKKNKVNTGLISFDAKIPTRYSLVLNFQGERTILSHHQKRKYAWPKNMPGVEWLYYTGLSEGYEALQEKMVAFLDKHPSVRLAFNPGSYQLKTGLAGVRELLAQTDILIINLEEAEKILGTTLEKEKSIAAIIHDLIALGAKEVAVTNAGEGAWAGNQDEIYHLDSFPVEIVSKAGAGDAFSSGFVSARFLGHDLPEALRWGVANSCGVIMNKGAQAGLMNKDGVKKMINKFSSIKPEPVN